MLQHTRSKRKYYGELNWKRFCFKVFIDILFNKHGKQQNVAFVVLRRSHKCVKQFLLCSNQTISVKSTAIVLQCSIWNITHIITLTWYIKRYLILFFFDIRAFRPHLNATYVSQPVFFYIYFYAPLSLSLSLVSMVQRRQTQFSGKRQQ